LNIGDIAMSLTYTKLGSTLVTTVVLSGLALASPSTPSSVPDKDGIQSILVEYDRAEFMSARSVERLQKSVRNVTFHANYVDAISAWRLKESSDKLYQVVGLTKRDTSVLKSSLTTFNSGRVAASAINLDVLDRSLLLGATDGGNGGGGDDILRKTKVESEKSSWTSFKSGNIPSKTLNLRIESAHSTFGRTDGGNGSGGDDVLNRTPDFSDRGKLPSWQKYREQTVPSTALDLRFLNRSSVWGNTDGGNGGGGELRYGSVKSHATGGYVLLLKGDANLPTAVRISGYLGHGAAVVASKSIDLVIVDRITPIGETPGGNGSGGDDKFPRSRPIISKSGLTIWSFPGTQFVEGTGAYSPKTTRGKYLVPTPIDFGLALRVESLEDLSNLVDELRLPKEAVFWQGKLQD
jgi:hypothetical protein